MTRLFVLLSILVAILAVPSAQTTPRTPWGDPDLEGTYTSDNSIGVPFERPMQFGTRATLTEEEYAQRAKGNADQLVRLDGRPHVGGVSMWMGDSRGHWEGDYSRHRDQARLPYASWPQSSPRP